MDLQQGQAPVNGTRRAATLWVAGVGAVLLVVAAAWFVAIRWSSIPDLGKLAIILGITMAFIVGGRRTRVSLPATASVLFHLGLFLVPVDLAAVNLRLGLAWEELLLAEGLLGLLVFGGGSLIERSLLLRSACVVSVVATALGIGATTPIPAPVALAAAAVALSVRWPASPATVWLGIGAGYLPVLALPFLQLDQVPHLIATLGLPEAGTPLPALVAGVASAIVLGRAAHIRREAPLALVAVGSLIASGVTAMVAAEPSRSSTLITLASVFVMVEIISLVVRDEFWAKTTGRLAVAAESCAAGATLHFSTFLLGFDGDRAMGVAVAFLAVGWAFATYRHFERSSEGLGWRLSALAVASMTVVAVQMTTMSVTAGATAMLVVGALLLVSRHPLTDGAAIVAMTAAMWTVPSDLGYPFAIVAAACTVTAAYVALREGRRDRGTMLLGSSILTLAAGAFRGADHLPELIVVLSFIAGAWLISFLVERVDAQLSWVPRIAALISLAATSSFGPEQRLAVSCVLIALFALDTLWTSDGRLLFGVVIPLQIVVVDVGLLAGLEAAHIGVALSIAAVIWAGLGQVVDGELRTPATTAAIVGAGAGIALSSLDPVALGISLVVSGGVLLGIAVLERIEVLGHIGGLLVIAGILTEISAARITVTEAYVAPVAAYLLVVGAVARRRGATSSWIAYAPAIVLLGSTALVERISGGGGWHAVVAGTVGVAAVAAGGWRRLAGPLFAGTALLAGVVGFESLAVTATVPTWGWLAVGGSALLATGILLERRELTPASAGRRVVEVIAANFE